MHGKLERDASGIANPFADPLGEFQMVPIARREVRTTLGDADDRLAGCELLLRQSKVKVALEIKCSHARIVRVIEPQLRAQGRPLSIAWHGKPPEFQMTAEFI
jgi:hypothetical protein